MAIEIRPVDREAIGEILVPLITHIGAVFSPERLERFKGIPELDLCVGAYEDGGLVGGMGSFTFSMMVPAERGTVPVETAGLTAVGVLPTHRRRGVLTGMMRRYLDDAHRRGQMLAALFASEGSIYGRFGYGMASLIVNAEIERDRSVFHGGKVVATRVRIVGEEEALETFPRVWAEACKDTPGMLGRSREWWRLRRLSDPEWHRAGRGPLQRVVLEEGGLPVAYTLYRHATETDQHLLVTSINVIEAIGASPGATRALWRYLCDIDLVTRVKAMLLPVDHPLLFLAAEVRRLRTHLSDGLWVRLIDVAGALSARGYGPGGSVVLAVKDAFCPWNDGRYKLEGGVARRTEEAAEIALDAETLGALYLGAFSFTQLAAAGRVEELREGALVRADRLFRAARAPWCPEMF